MKLQIKKQEARYLRCYQLVAGFKAGIHCGRVVAGEARSAPSNKKGRTRKYSSVH
jgi:hypothetical protein